MPKSIIDYSNTIIYKIYCKDDTIKDMYVGHTTNFVKRKYSHKTMCANVNNKLKIYKIIRENGGWDNWEMVEIAKYNCKDNTEARIKEYEHYNSLKATLNSCIPYANKPKYVCNECNIYYTNETKLNHHNYVNHKIINEEIMKNIEVTENNAYKCTNCNFSCHKNSNWQLHIQTKKHKINTNGINMEMLGNEKNTELVCYRCKQIFQSKSGLWKHTKKCNYIQPNITDEKKDIDIYDLFKKQNEIIEQLTQQNKLLVEQNNNLAKLVQINKIAL